MGNIYTCNKFTGWYPVPTAAVVIADDEEEAANALNEKLVKMGLDGNAEEKDMIYMSSTFNDIRILSDGNY